jgi:hypothetical protein
LEESDALHYLESSCLLKPRKASVGLADLQLRDGLRRVKTTLRERAQSGKRWVEV